MMRRLKNGIVGTGGNQGACPLVYSRTGAQVSAASQPLQDSSELMLHQLINQQALTFYL
jgi:hypothetical protein